MIGPSHRRRWRISGARRPSKREERPRASGGAEEMRERVGAVGKLDRLDARLIEQDRALEHIHRRRIETRTQVDVGSPGLPLALDHRRRCLARESGSVEHVVVEQNPHRAGPFERSKRRLNRAAQRVVEGQQPRRLPGAQDKVRQPFGPIGEGADDQRLWGGHEGNVKLRSANGYRLSAIGAASLQRAPIADQPIADSPVSTAPTPISAPVSRSRDRC